jgi:HEPN domain-containing protein
MIVENKVKAAEVLYEAGLYDDSFYLCGYAIELLLKASICEKLDLDDLFNFDKINTRRLFPEKKNNSNFKQLYKQFKVHDFEQLVLLAGLFNFLTTSIEKDYQLKLEWSLAFEWSEQSRYQLKYKKTDAKNYFNATKYIMKWFRKNLQSN